MGLDILPKAGSSFRPSRLGIKVSKLTRYQGGEFGNLRDNQKNIVSALKKFSGVIKGYGGLNRLQQKAVIRDVKKTDKHLTKEDKLDLKKIVAYYSRGKAVGSSSRSSRANGSSKAESEEYKAPLKLRINRDPNSGLDFKGIRDQARPGVAARVNRAVSAAQLPKPGNHQAPTPVSGSHFSALDHEADRRHEEHSSAVSISQLHQNSDEPGRDNEQDIPRQEKPDHINPDNLTI